ncbi:MAG: Spy/CpxP family protein refolding chaperone [Hyphomonadaceae bacterium]|jgi:hypothetical protein|nr:Spy/CpxP family protein refolding chaperone [Hyphomonadaceae bacterium]
MKTHLFKFVVPAVLAAGIPAAAVLAQTQGQGQPPASADGPSAETLARLQDGRIAMIKAALKLSDAQLKLWMPVEEHMRASFAARQQARAERRERRQQGAAEQSASLPDRLDRASERMTKRAERMKAYAEAIKPLYASLTDDQKAVASVVLRPGAGLGRLRDHRWAQHSAPRGEPR